MALPSCLIRFSFLRLSCMIHGRSPVHVGPRSVRVIWASIFCRSRRVRFAIILSSFFFDPSKPRCRRRRTCYPGHFSPSDKALECGTLPNFAITRYFSADTGAGCLAKTVKALCIRLLFARDSCRTLYRGQGFAPCMIKIYYCLLYIKHTDYFAGRCVYIFRHHGLQLAAE